MYTEIAFTPHIFDEDCNTDNEKWYLGIYNLGQGLLPKTAAEPIILSDIYGGSCLNEAVANISRIKDHRVRVLAQSCAQKMSKLSVIRPSESDWPQSEQDWLGECENSFVNFPMGRVLISNSHHQHIITQMPAFSIYDPADDQSGFWNDIQSQGRVNMNLDDQVNLLRPICVHADYIAIKSPQIRGGSDDETVFAARIIQSALNRPTNYPEIKVIEFHLDDQHNSNHDNSVINIIQLVRRITAKSNTGLKINFYFWPHYTDRELVAGLLKNGIKSPRWGISMNHIARPADTSGSTTWNIIAQKNLDDIANTSDTQIFDMKEDNL